MARKVVYQIIDDLDGSVLPDGLGETVKFGLDGVEYEIDLSNENAALLREQLGEYIRKARRVGGRAQRGTRTQLPATGPKRDLTAIRKWANANGYEVADRGRIPHSVLDAYDQAQEG
ncbi:histone-like nucleoid-structuring protein Lsr2 [Gulosibacter chungangensis]|uniref:Lsr2 family protein n=1 Tax=Gulosibacter chungangensis TaxID=979746 RepID=A0A7J5B8X1_9MICO|nr:Lsr2 family protein [Gulosibacter chungangensis]KAB1641910.1 Lsr2 family protein [Gulosibacter chungangensis]